MSPMVRTNITLDPGTIDLIKDIAAATGASKSEIIRRGVISYSRELSERIGAQTKSLKRRLRRQPPAQSLSEAWNEPVRKELAKGKTEKKKTGRKAR